MERPVIDPNFEPRARARSNTWPLRPTVEPGELSEPPAAVTEEVVDSTSRGIVQSLASAASAKKGNARRNAWGSSSYAELITNAIQSSPENRLTLSQIYEWMVQNVPYFKDKGDSNSSAGWKNSIRHNLSLHNRFVRTQNEGAGKSSWWIINPDAKAGKSPRRRAYSMENKDKAMEKKRGRVKKKVEALRASADGLGSPNSTISENHELLMEPGVHTLQLSPEFRPRTNSNASSCGRISPIRPQLLQDIDDGMPPVSWNRGSTSSLNLPFKDSYGDINLSDMITLTLADSTVDDEMVGDFGVFNNFTPSQPPQQQQYLRGYGHLPPPPPYHDQQPSPLGTQQQQGQLMLNTINSTVNPPPDQLSPHQASVVVSSGGQMHQLQSIQSSPRQDVRQDYSSDDVSMYPNSPGLFSHGLLTSMNSNLNGRRSPMRQNLDRSILRDALTRPDAPTLASLLSAPDNGPMQESPPGASCPGDLYELGPMTDWQDLGCDVNEVIKLELKVEGNFDCTFDSINPSITNDY